MLENKLLNISEIKNLSFNPSFQQIWKNIKKEYERGTLKNIRFQTIGTFGDMLLPSKGRVYSNDAVVNAYHEFKKLLKNEPYYRMMFDSHPSQEDDNINGGFGESNTSEDIVGQVNDVKLKEFNILGKKYNYIWVDFIITKQSILDFLVRVGNFVFGISGRGLIGGVKYINNLDGFILFKENIDIISKLSKIELYNKLCLIGYDFVTFPALPCSTVTVENIIGYNYDTLKDYQYYSDNINISNDLWINYITNESKINTNEYNNYFIESCNESIDCLSIYDSLKIFKNMDRGNKMVDKLNLVDLLTNKEYTFSIFDYLISNIDDVEVFFSDNNEFSVDEFVSDVVINDEQLDEEEKVKLADAIKFMYENREEMKDLFNVYFENVIDDVISTSLEDFVSTFDNQFINELINNGFNYNQEDVEHIISSTQENSLEDEEYKELRENLLELLNVMKEEPEEQGSILNEYIEQRNNEGNFSLFLDSLDNIDNDIEDEEMIEEEEVLIGDKKDEQNDIKIAPLETDKQVGDEVFSEASKLRKLVESAEYDEEKFKAIIDEVFGIVRCYNKQSCQKLPHHEIIKDGEEYKVALNLNGLRSATNHLLGARGGVIATRAEKVKCAKHLLRHYEELNIEPPVRLRKMAENSIIGFIPDDKDYILTVADSVIEHLLDDENIFVDYGVSIENIDGVVKAIDNMIAPFISDGGIIELGEQELLNCVKVVSNAVMMINKVLNGEPLVNDKENTLYNDEKVVEEISELKDKLNEALTEVSKYKSAMNQLNEEKERLENERIKLLDKLNEIEEQYKITDSVVNKTKELWEKKIEFIYKYKDMIDEDLFNEIRKCNDTQELNLVEKYISKFYSNKITFNIPQKHIPSDNVDDNNIPENKATDNIVFYKFLSKENKNNENDFVNKLYKMILVD